VPFPAAELVSRVTNSSRSTARTEYSQKIVATDATRIDGGHRMSVAKVSEISVTSSKSFEDAIQQGLTRAGKTLRHVRGAWIKEQHVRCDDDGRINEYQVNMMVTFVLDD
jgi:flavin-binding protein dodecin